MTRARFIETAGRRILCLDFARVHDQDTALAAIEEARAAIAGEREDSVYTITDVSDSMLDRTVLRALMQLALHNKAFVRAGAVVGADPQLRAHLDITRVADRDLPFFADHDAALAWVLAQP